MAGAPADRVRTGVLVVDDHALVRASIRRLLESLPGVEVVGEVPNGEEALELCRSLRPDVVFMDVAMSGIGGLEATAEITRNHPSTRVIVLSIHGAAEYVDRALRSGATGYLLKGAEVTEFRLALEAVRRGQTYVSPRLTEWRSLPGSDPSLPV